MPHARGNGSIPLCLSLNEIGIYGGAARTLGLTRCAASMREGGVKIRRKQIFEAEGWVLRALGGSTARRKFVGTKTDVA